MDNDVCISMARKSRISSDTIKQLITQFVANTLARSAALLCGVSRETAVIWYRRFREIIAEKLSEKFKVFSSEIEVDESYFGARQKGHYRDTMEYHEGTLSYT